MEYTLTKLNENDFTALNCKQLFGDNRTYRMFAKISKLNSCFKFAWQSDLISPSVFEVNNVICCIGVDLNFAIIDFNSNTILLNLQLDYFYYGVFIANNHIFVITELEVLKINVEKFKIIDKFGLPEFYQSSTISDELIEISCINGEIVKIK